MSLAVTELGHAAEKQFGQPVIYATVYVTGLVQETFTVVLPFSYELPKGELVRHVPRMIREAIEDLFGQRPPRWKRVSGPPKTTDTQSTDRD